MVQGVALELLCRLLFTWFESLSLRFFSFINVTDYNVSNQIKIDIIILTVRPLFTFTYFIEIL